MAAKIWYAPAKLNLFLHITSKREDGYHNLQTIFQLLDYSDEIQFVRRQDNNFHRNYNIPLFAQQDDLIIKSALALKDHALEHKLISHDFNFGVDIKLNKKIPMGAGLGGGSSNAATALVALNQLWKFDLSQQQLMKLGAQLGADVPIFIFGKNAWAEGIGEQLKPLQLEPCVYVVLKPDVHIVTRELFSHPDLHRQMPLISFQDYMDKNHHNVFQALVCDQYPQVKKAIDWLSEFSPARMTGTGSCIFAAVKDSEEAGKILEQLPDNLSGFWASTVDHSPLFDENR